MASTELTIPGGDNKLALPAHLARRFADKPSEIVTGNDRGASLTIRGKVFTIAANGETTQVTKTDEEGNELPAGSLQVVILDYVTKSGREYYAGNFDPNNITEATCYSNDGVTPEPDSPEVQSPKCATCQWSAKGSRVSDGGIATRACGTVRILAVVPIKRLDLEPLRLRLAQTSIYDGKSPEAKAKSMFAFTNYLDALKARGVPNTRCIVTSLSFDPKAAFPKLFFKPVRYLTDEEMDRVEEIIATGAVANIVGELGTLPVPEGHALPPKPAKAALPGPATAAVADDEGEEEEDEDDRNIRLARERKEAKQREAAALAAANAAKAKTEAVAKPAPEPAQDEDEDDDDYAIRLATWRKAQKAKATAAPAAAPKPVPFCEMEDGEDEDDYALARAAHNKAEKARIAAAGGAAPAAAPKAAAAAPAAAEPAKRTRRTKAEMEAARAAEAKGKPAVAEEVPAGEEKPASSFGGDDDDEVLEAAPAKPKANGAAKPAAAPTRPVTEAAVPANVAAMLGTWDDE